MKNFSFTKLIMAIMMALNIAVVAFVCVMMWRTGDLSPAPYLLIGEGGAVATWLASYAWKETRANSSKYAMLFVKEIAEKYTMDDAIRLAEIVLQE